MTDVYAEEVLTERFKELPNLITKTEEIETDDGITKTVIKYLDVAFPNIPFQRPDNGYWYELYFMTQAPDQIELGSYGRNRWRGIMQVNICVPKSSGTQAVNERFNAIAALFRQGMNLAHVRINKVYRGTAIEDGDFYSMPVSVEWWSDLYH